jgi:integrase
MSKRNNGDGSIFKVSDNKWVATIQVGKSLDGKPKRKQFSAKTEKEVKRKLAEFKKNRSILDSVQNSQITVADYASRFLAFKKPALKPTSYQRLNSTIDTYIIPNFNYTFFSELTTQDIQNLINEISKQKSYSTGKKIYDCLNAMYKYDLGLPPQQQTANFNPCTNVIVNKNSFNTSLTTNNEVKYFTDEELVKIQSEICRCYDTNGKPVYPYGLLFTIILNTGLRIGEILAITKKDIDLNNKTLTVSKNVIQIKNPTGKGYITKIQNNPKTFSGNRTLSLNSASINAINALYELFPNQEYLALNSNGKPVTPQNAEKTFSQILKSCKIDSRGRKCHALRHTFATKLFMQGIDVKMVSHILGHSSTSFTRDVYISIIQKTQAIVMEKIPEIKIEKIGE